MWKVIGCHDSSGYNRAVRGEMYGPHPAKLWVGPHVEKRRKIKKAPTTRTPTSDDEWKRKAIEYARWLAQRDGIELPTRGEIHVAWDCVNSKTRMHGHKRWNGTISRHPVQERRIRAVEWGHEKPIYNTRKDGRQGAWLYNDWVVDFEFVLPNWDFNPDTPVEEIIADDAPVCAVA